MPNILKFWRSPIAEGIVPDNLLFHTYSLRKLTSFPIPGGMLPKILLLSRNNEARVVEKLLMHSGINPPKLLSLSSNNYNLVALVKEQRKLKSSRPPLPRWFVVITNWESLCNFSKWGTSPVSLFSAARNSSNLEALFIEGGIAPVKWLKPMPKCWRFGRVKPKSKGIFPCIRFNTTLKAVMEERLKIEEGICQTTCFRLMPGRKDSPGSLKYQEYSRLYY